MVMVWRASRQLYVAALLSEISEFKTPYICEFIVVESVPPHHWVPFPGTSMYLLNHPCKRISFTALRSGRAGV